MTARVIDHNTDPATDHPVFQRARAAARLRPDLRMARLPVPVTRLSNAPVVLVRDRGIAALPPFVPAATQPTPDPVPPSEPLDTPRESPPPQPVAPPDVIELPPSETPQPITEPPMTTLAVAPTSHAVAAVRR